MSSNKKNQTPEDEAVQKEMAQYNNKVSWFRKIPFWVRAIFFKYWGCGVQYFFVNMGLESYILGDGTDYTIDSYILFLVVSGLIYGVISFFLVGFIYEMMENEKGQAQPYEIFYSRKWYTIIIDCAFGFVWAFFANFLNAKCASLVNTNWLFHDPFSFGVIGLAVDMAIVGLKDLIVYIYRKIRHKEVI